MSGTAGNTIASGKKTLAVLKFLAERGVVAERDIADALFDGQVVSARRYLQTLASCGFASRENGAWALGLEGYRLPQQFLLNLFRQQQSIERKLAAFFDIFDFKPNPELLDER